MNKRALLVGSPFGGLTAMNNDLAAMRAALEAYDFECELLADAAATRVNIVAAYEALIDATGMDDSALFYFTGHGGLIHNPDREGRRDPSESYRFIVPIDFDRGTERDFRGVTNHELSHLLGRLLARTENVTVVLDCCHAARLSRHATDEALRVKALPSYLAGVDAHLEQLRSRGIDTATDGRNPARAVVISACGESESAYQRRVAGKGDVSVLTEFLAEALGLAHGSSVDWRNLLVRVREQVQASFKRQRPVVEGAAQRRLFSLRENEQSDVLTLVRTGQELRLTGGSLLGLEVGDLYAVESLASPPQVLALARVTRVYSSSSVVEVELEPGRELLSDMSRARLVRRALPSLPVYVDPRSDGAAELYAAVGARSELELVTEVATRRDAMVLLAQAGQVKVSDPEAMALFAPKPSNAEGLARALDALRPYARMRALLRLEGNAPELDRSYRLTWGTVAEQAEQPLPLHGATLQVGQRIYLRLTSCADKPLWLSLIDVGVTAERTLLNAMYAPEGYEVRPEASFVLGERGGRLLGVPLTWPPELAASGPRPETLIVIVSDRPHDLRPLAGSGARGAASRPSSLQRLLDRIERGGGDEEHTTTAELGYSIAQISFLLDPRLAA